MVIRGCKRIADCDGGHGHGDGDRKVKVCPYCKISGGVSNLSFGFRGVNVIREVGSE